MFRRVLNALNAMFFGQVISRLSSFLLVPLFLSYWSPTIYGEWLALFALVGYLASLDVGVQLAAVNRLTADYSRRDSRGYQQVQHSALALYVGIALVGSLVALVALLVLPIPKWIGIRATGSSTARTVLIILALYVLWAMPARVITCVYRTVGRLAKSERLYILQTMITAVLTG